MFFFLEFIEDIDENELDVLSIRYLEDFRLNIYKQKCDSLKIENHILAVECIAKHNKDNICNKEISEKIMSAKHPLLLFNFTVHGRWTFFHPLKGRLHSHFALNLDEFKDTDGPFVFHQKSLVAKTLTLKNDFYSKSFLDPWPDKGGYPHAVWGHDRFGGDNNECWLGPHLYATHQAIKMALNYKKLMPHATIKWGFIHEQSEEQSFSKDIFTIINGLEAKINGESWASLPGKLLSYPGLEDCYNKYTEWKPLGRLSPGKSDDLQITKKDYHPNEKGIALMADIMYNCLQGIHNYE